MHIRIESYQTAVHLASQEALSGSQTTLSKHLSYTVTKHVQSRVSMSTRLNERRPHKHESRRMRGWGEARLALELQLLLKHLAARTFPGGLPQQPLGLCDAQLDTGRLAAEGPGGRQRGVERRVRRQVGRSWQGPRHCQACKASMSMSQKMLRRYLCVQWAAALSQLCMDAATETAAWPAGHQYSYPNLPQIAPCVGHANRKLGVDACCMKLQSFNMCWFARWD